MDDDTRLIGDVLAKLAALGLTKDGKPVDVTRENVLDVLDGLSVAQAEMAQRLASARRKRLNALAALTDD